MGIAAKIGSKIGKFFRKLFGSGQWIAFVVLIGLTAVRVWNPEPVEFVRLKVFDTYQKIKPRENLEQNVVVIDLDEQSLAEVGQWPWGRDKVAQMVVNAHRAGAQLVGFDIVFAEPDRLSPDLLAETLPNLDPEMRERLKSMGSTDAVFANVLKQARSVLGQAADESLAAGDLVRPEPAAIATVGGDPRPFLQNYPSLVGNLKMFEDVAGGRGLFTVYPEKDNVVRRIPVVARSEDKIYPALSLEMLRVFTKNSTIGIRLDEAGQGIKDVFMQGSRRIIFPTDRMGLMWPYYSKLDKSRYIPAKDVLNATFDPKRMAGKLVLFGASAAGLRDLRTTAVDENIPGVEVHAQLIESVFAESLLQRPLEAEMLEGSLVIGGGLFMLIAMALVGARWTMGVFIAATAAMIGVSWYYFSAERTMIDATAPVVVALAVYMTSTYISYTREEAQRQQIKNTFAFYLSPAMVDKLAEHPDQLKLGGETRDMTIFFSDVRGFTTISEMFDAQGLTAFMNRYLTPMTDIALAHGAYIDKYIGDAIMAFWNAPLEDLNHARSACDTVLEMRTALVALNEELQAEATKNGTKMIPIGIGMGLNSGPCVVGNMGSNQKFNYSVLGDAVNLASRLEGQSKPYHTDNVIGEATQVLVPDYATLEIDSIRVKGKTVPVTIFTLVGKPDVAQSGEFKALKEVHDTLIAGYRGQRWDECETLIARARVLAEPFGIVPLYQTYEDRIAEYRADPPPVDWDGVYVATSK